MAPSNRKCSCARCMARAASNATKAEKTLDEVSRYVGAWPGMEIVGSEFRYVPDDKFPRFKLVMRVEFEADVVVFQCDSGGPTTLLVALGESADRDIVAWIHSEVVNSLASMVVSDDDSDHSRPNPGLEPLLRWLAEGQEPLTDEEVAKAKAEFEDQT